VPDIAATPAACACACGHYGLIDPIHSRKLRWLRHLACVIVAMISIDLDTVQFIIDKAREFQALESGTDDSVPSDDPSREELMATIADLEPDQQIELVALMWLGRGDFSIDEWKDAVAEATRAYNARTADYLIATPLLADYLLEGLDQHGYDAD
jgi:hypothetical protein